jgi:hypothetical protein
MTALFDLLVGFRQQCCTSDFITKPEVIVAPPCMSSWPLACMFLALCNVRWEYILICDYELLCGEVGIVSGRSEVRLILIYV